MINSNGQRGVRKADMPQYERIAEAPQRWDHWDNLPEGMFPSRFPISTNPRRPSFRGRHPNPNLAVPGNRASFASTVSTTTNATAWGPAAATLGRLEKIRRADTAPATRSQTLGRSGPGNLGLGRSADQLDEEWEDMVVPSDAKENDSGRAIVDFSKIPPNFDIVDDDTETSASSSPRYIAPVAAAVAAEAMPAPAQTPLHGSPLRGNFPIAPPHRQPSQRRSPPKASSLREEEEEQRTAKAAGGAVNTAPSGGKQAAQRRRAKVATLQERDVPLFGKVPEPFSTISVHKATVRQLGDEDEGSLLSKPAIQPAVIVQLRNDSGRSSPKKQQKHKKVESFVSEAAHAVNPSAPHPPLPEDFQSRVPRKHRVEPVLVIPPREKSHAVRNKQELQLYLAAATSQRAAASPASASPMPDRGHGGKERATQGPDSRPAVPGPSLPQTRPMATQPQAATADPVIVVMAPPNFKRFSDISLLSEAAAAAAKRALLAAGTGTTTAAAGVPPNFDPASPTSTIGFSTLTLPMTPSELDEEERRLDEEERMLAMSSRAFSPVGKSTRKADGGPPGMDPLPSANSKELARVIEEALDVLAMERSIDNAGVNITRVRRTSIGQFTAASDDESEEDDDSIKVEVGVRPSGKGKLVADEGSVASSEDVERAIRKATSGSNAPRPSPSSSAVSSSIPPPPSDEVLLSPRAEYATAEDDVNWVDLPSPPQHFTNSVVLRILDQIEVEYERPGMGSPLSTAPLQSPGLVHPESTSEAGGGAASTRERASSNSSSVSGRMKLLLVEPKTAPPPPPPPSAYAWKAREQRAPKTAMTSAPAHEAAQATALPPSSPALASPSTPMQRIPTVSTRTPTHLRPRVPSISRTVSVSRRPSFSRKPISIAPNPATRAAPGALAPVHNPAKPQEAAATTTGGMMHPPPLRSLSIPNGVDPRKPSPGAPTPKTPSTLHANQKLYPSPNVFLPPSPAPLTPPPTTPLPPPPSVPPAYPALSFRSPADGAPASAQPPTPAAQTAQPLQQQPYPSLPLRNESIPGTVTLRRMGGMQAAPDAVDASFKPDRTPPEVDPPATAAEAAAATEEAIFDLYNATLQRGAKARTPEPTSVEPVVVPVHPHRVPTPASDDGVVEEPEEDQMPPPRPVTPGPLRSATVKSPVTIPPRGESTTAVAAAVAKTGPTASAEAAFATVRIPPRGESSAVVPVLPTVEVPKTPPATHGRRTEPTAVGSVPPTVEAPKTPPATLGRRTEPSAVVPVPSVPEAPAPKTPPATLGRRTEPSAVVPMPPTPVVSVPPTAEAPKTPPATLARPTASVPSPAPDPAAAPKTPPATLPRRVDPTPQPAPDVPPTPSVRIPQRGESVAAAAPADPPRPASPSPTDPAAPSFPPRGESSIQGVATLRRVKTPTAAAAPVLPLPDEAPPPPPPLPLSVSGGNEAKTPGVEEASEPEAEVGVATEVAAKDQGQVSPPPPSSVPSPPPPLAATPVSAPPTLAPAPQKPPVDAPRPIPVITRSPPTVVIPTRGSSRAIDIDAVVPTAAAGPTSPRTPADVARMFVAAVTSSANRFPPVPASLAVGLDDEDGEWAWRAVRGPRSESVRGIREVGDDAASIVPSVVETVVEMVEPVVEEGKVVEEPGVEEGPEAVQVEAVPVVQEQAPVVSPNTEKADEDAEDAELMERLKAIPVPDEADGDFEAPEIVASPTSAVATAPPPSVVVPEVVVAEKVKGGVEDGKTVGGEDGEAAVTVAAVPEPVATAQPAAVAVQPAPVAVQPTPMAPVQPTPMAPVNPAPMEATQPVAPPRGDSSRSTTAQAALVLSRVASASASSTSDAPPVPPKDALRPLAAAGLRVQVATAAEAPIPPPDPAVFFGSAVSPSRSEMEIVESMRRAVEGGPAVEIPGRGSSRMIAVGEVGGGVAGQGVTGQGVVEAVGVPVGVEGVPGVQGGVKEKLKNGGGLLARLRIW
ncbi:hypothetical protein HDU96_009064 [Phlyctochytrium bullatum]|nr:hypothetical protein HDU96_009064 [Phlyctochytrium bullatum]